ncbi:MAG: S8 family serine peptidase, partial [Verrucomicrobiae bacterium]|nr:S8 family serine peptidase [Verrucomicrobiae bacterium]
GQTASLVVEKGQPGNLRLDLWYPTDGSGEVGLEFTIKAPGGATYGPYAPVIAENLRDTRSAAGVFTYYHNGRDVDFFNSTSSKREVLIDFIGATGTYTIDIRRPAAAASAREFIATLNFSNYSQNPQNAFKTFNVPGNVWDGATGFNNISPADYVLQTSWTDINGVLRTAPASAGAIGGIWSGSSTGPTFDGRFGVDVAAPGEFLMTVYAPDSYWATFDFNKVRGGNGLYGKANAVSAAAPIVTGIIALMLQANPELDQIQVRDILRSTARADAFTGAVPNNTWGYGKVDAYAAVRQALLRRAAPLNAVIERSGPSPTITFPTLRGLAYRIVYKNKLDDFEWLPLISEIPGTGTPATHTDANLGAEQTRFYRIGAE